MYYDFGGSLGNLPLAKHRKSRAINAKEKLTPFVLNLENPYAAMAHKIVLTTMEIPTIKTVFPIFSKSPTFSIRNL